MPTQVHDRIVAIIAEQAMLDAGFVPDDCAEVNDRLMVDVENPIPETDVSEAQVGRTGNHIAVDNIAQRLNLIYGDSARLEMGKDPRLDGPVFCVRMVLPKAPENNEFS